MAEAVRQTAPAGGTHIAGGYLRANPIAINAAYLRVYGSAGPKRRRDFYMRVYLAVLLANAVREMADARARRPRGSTPRSYTVADLVRLLGGTAGDAEITKRVRTALRFWGRSGLITWALNRTGISTRVSILQPDDPADLPAELNTPDLWAALSGLSSRTGRRRTGIPVPLRWVRYLSRDGTRATIAAGLAIATRAIFEAGGGAVNLGGRIRGVAVSRIYGITARAYRAAVRKLEGAGLISIPDLEENRARWGSQWREHAERFGTWVDVSADAPVCNKISNKKHGFCNVSRESERNGPERERTGVDSSARDRGKGVDSSAPYRENRKFPIGNSCNRKPRAGVSRGTGAGPRDPAGRGDRLRRGFELEVRRGLPDTPINRERWIAVHWYTARHWRNGRAQRGPRIRDPRGYALAAFRRGWKIAESDFDDSRTWYFEAFGADDCFPEPTAQIVPRNAESSCNESDGAGPVVSRTDRLIAYRAILAVRSSGRSDLPKWSEICCNVAVSGDDWDRDRWSRAVAAALTFFERRHNAGSDYHSSPGWNSSRLVSDGIRSVCPERNR